MAKTASGSGSGAQPNNTVSPKVAEQVLAVAPAAASTPIDPPTVTLTIESGSLSMDSIGALSDFVKAALSAGPAMAFGRAGAGVASGSVDKEVAPAAAPRIEGGNTN